MKERKKRILHVVTDLEYAGRQTWLYSLLKYIDQDRFQLVFLLRDASDEGSVDRFRRLGAEIYQIRAEGNILPDPRYLYEIFGIFRNFGPFDVIHCHDGFDSIWALTAATLAGVPIRIIHSHSYYVRRRDWFSPSKTGMRWLKRKVIRRCATHGFASRPHNASALFGRYWIRDKRWHNLFCGIDLSRFERITEDSSIRLSLGIPRDAFVVGHVGRFSKEKNHRKIISVFSALRRKRPDAHLLLIGDGKYRTLIEKKARRFGLSPYVHFAGNRKDVPLLLKSATDVFLFPSRYVGLGTAFLEAQAAGLPCVISRDLPKSIEVDSGRVARLDIKQSDDVWARALISAGQKGRIAFSRKQFSRFDIALSVDIWHRVYATGAVF